MTSSLNRTSSWVVVDLKTNEAVLETFNERLADAVNREKYKVVPILAYLQSLNRKD
jgi:hypothetical protein